MNEIAEWAGYCLNCKMKPCSLKGCPIQTNIPEFITEIKNENYEKAHEILQTNNIFSYVCSIVCPQEKQCEGSCVRGIKSTPTHIGKLEKFVNEYAIKNNIELKIEKKEPNGKKIAVVGAGPAGLECTTELLKEGFEVDVFEKENFAGGILVYGIPDFRLSKDIVSNIINKIEKLGANFILNKEFGKDIKLEELRNRYDAVFLGIGAPRSSIYPLSDENLDSVYDSDIFLRKYSDKDFIKNLGTVVVIGGGNVAMDCARTAVKMGAEKVKILYRRDRIHMPAREVELDDALKDGVQFKELTRVVSANINNGKIESVNCVRTQIIDGKAQDIENAEEFKEEANTVVFAIGLKPDKNLISNEGIELNEWGYIKINEDGQTNIQNVYAGGDVSENKATVCRALAAGRKAAFGIMKNVKF